MNALVRKLRGALGTALTWAVTWAAILFPVISIEWWLDDGFLRLSYWWNVGWGSAIAAASGFVAGGAFSLAVAGFGRNRRLEDLRTAPMALLGAAAGAIVPVVLLSLQASGALGLILPAGWELSLESGRMMIASGIFAAMGAGTAGGLIQIAKRADVERLPPGE